MGTAARPFQTPQPGIPAVILAGGRAARMGGGDKGLLGLGGQSLLSRVVARLASQTGPMALNANGDAGRFADFGLPVIADDLPGFPGPLAGILAAMDWAATQGAAMVATAAADTPFLPVDLVARLADAAPPDRPGIAASPDTDGRMRAHPTFGLWPVGLRGDLRQALAAGMRKPMRWADDHGAVRVEWLSTPIDPFFNINTPDDLARATAMLASVPG